MKSNLKPVLAALLLLVSLAPCSAQGTKDDLFTLYSGAKAHDPSVGRAQAQLEESKADTDISLSQLMPRVDANASINWVSSTTLNYAVTDITGSFTGDGYGVGVRLPIFQLPAVYGLAASRAAERAAKLTLQASRQDLIIQVAELYFQLLKARSDEQFCRDEQKRYGQLLDQALRLQQSGAGELLAVFDAKAHLENASTELIKALNQGAQVAQQLSTLVGREVTEVRDLGANLAKLAQPADLQWWLDTQQKQHPALLHAREELVQSDLQIKAVKAGHLPVLQATAGYTVSKGSTFLPLVETRQWYAGFNISLPLYAGGETAARTRRARAVESEQGFILSAVNDQNVQKLKQFYQELSFNTALIAALDRKMEVAQLQLAAIKTGFDLGTRTVAELLIAEQGVSYIQRDLANAGHDQALRSLSLKYAAGILTEDDLQMLNSRLAK